MATVQVQGMSLPGRVPEEQARLAAAALADLSGLRRCGLKGPSAAQWLKAQGIEVPDAANRWADLPGDGVVARLGRSEFFLEDGPRGDAAQRVQQALGPGRDGVHPVVRQDAGIALLGPRGNEVLVQVCNVDFEAIAQREAVMTQMAGVSVLAIRRDATHRDLGALRCVRLWCDPTFAPYLWDTLVGIAAELGGGVVGSEGPLA
jgi:sarcosine oxidase subunit gamma